MGDQVLDIARFGTYRSIILNTCLCSLPREIVMEMQLIRTFLSLAEVKKLSVCADLLCLTKSAVSSRIRQLEQQLGHTLFTGSHSGMVLTESGQAFYPHAVTLLRQWEQARQVLSNPARDELCIGAHPALAHDILLPWCNRIWQDNRQLKLHMVAHYSQEMISEVMAGRVDIGLIFRADITPGLVIEPVMEDQLLMVSSDPLSSMAEVLPEDYLYLDWGWGYSAAHAERLPHLEQCRVSSGHGELGLDWLLLNGGSAYLPARTARHYLESHRLFLIQDAPEFKRPIFAVYQQQTLRNTLMTDALALLVK